MEKLPHTLSPKTPRHAWRWWALAAAGAAVLAVAGCTVWRLGEARALARASEPFQQRPDAPALALLVVGDSTAVGTGATHPAASLAGLLGTAYPRLRIDNHARDGARFNEVPAQLARAAAGGDKRWDVILICAGGNDVIRGTDEVELAQAIQRSFEQALKLLKPGGKVVTQPAGNVGNAPFFLPPVSSLMSRRARSLHTSVRTAAQAQGVAVVNLYKDAEADPFAQRKELNASDGLHPSDAGYQVWRDELLAQTDLAQRLSAAR